MDLTTPGARGHWGIRVAAQPPDGGPHVLRCLALAEALERRGRPVRFFVDEGRTFWPALQRRLYRWKPEPDPAGAWAMLEDVAAGELEACIFDGVQFDPRAVTWAAARVLTVEIDDRHLRPHGHVVINPGLAAEPSRYPLPASQVLCGVDFAMLRSSLAEARGATLDRLSAGGGLGPADRLLVAMEAVEADDATALVLDALALIPHRGVVIVILGSRAPNLDAVMRRVTAMEAVMVEVDVDDLADYYLASDLVIGDGGNLLLERMCCGIPSISLALTPDQQRANARAAGYGATIDGGLA
ncbi:MAG: hypothetical protein H6842_04475, partial [Rhodospirillaceae bacterium]|nr:hypothetical protein [Rhodospirillaceae bacterium]